ncbi:endonuclease III domain-containing protein [bacterium]|nr:endonuclease III domain-containing protein [bacterium]
MRRHRGNLGWWPGESPFEIAIGAILTQNTAWTNVEKAIANLKCADVMEARAMFTLAESELAQLIRPAGYFNVKARRVRNFLRVLVEEYDARLDQMLAGDTAEVRTRLLAINGIGRETADSILLYAGTHHSFVIDAYTKRIFERHQWWSNGLGASSKSKVQGAKLSPPKGNTVDEYESLKLLCESSLNHKSEAEHLDYWRDYHAQLVMIGKDYCRPREPRCKECPLLVLLPKLK